jgi:hypothetical protein
MADRHSLEFYPTPAAFTRYLFRRVEIAGAVLEPCVGDGAIVRDSLGFWPDTTSPDFRPQRRVWFTNDLDAAWPADLHQDAAAAPFWKTFSGEIDWTVTNPPFSLALQIAERALQHSRRGVALHLRASIHEVLKTGPRRTWMAEHRPTGILWLPRFAYQRSPKTGQWTTDSVCACWLVWDLSRPREQFIDYAPEWVIDAMDAETAQYRAHVDALMGFTGTEAERRAQRQAVAA